MPPSILSSNLITIPVLDTLIAQTAGHPSQQPKRVQLLSTKLAILTNRPSQPARGQPFDIELQIIQCRLDLAEAYLSASSPGALAAYPHQAGASLKLAETELGLVERECKGVSKRYSRLVFKEKEKRARRSARDREHGDDDEEEEEGVADAGPSTTSSGTGTGPSTPSTVHSHTATTSPALSDPSPSMPTTGPGSPGSPPLDETKRQARLRIIIANRVKALRMMAIVEDRSGRPDRKARWEAQADRLEAG